MFVARQDRPLGACAQDFYASPSNSRPGGGAESVERSGSPGGAGRSGLWEAWRCQCELQQRIHKALETTDRFTAD